MHERSGAPNQDAVATGLVDGGGLVIALADGHGASRHVRSDRGAAIAVEFAIEQARSAVFARHSAEHPLVAATDRILAGWRARVLDDYQARPFTEQERRRAGVDLDDAPLIAYGATLLISVLAADQVHLAQIGDGDIVVVTEQGASRLQYLVTRALSPMKRPVCVAPTRAPTFGSLRSRKLMTPPWLCWRPMAMAWPLLMQIGAKPWDVTYSVRYAKAASMAWPISFRAGWRIPPGSVVMT
jgi:hypothetical protein